MNRLTYLMTKRERSERSHLTSGLEWQAVRAPIAMVICHLRSVAVSAAAAAVNDFVVFLVYIQISRPQARPIGL